MLEMDIDIPTGHADLLGYEYTTHAQAPVVGGRHITYHLNRPEVWHTPVYSDIQPVNDAIVTLPQGGYLIPAGWTSVVLPYLQKHGITYQVLPRNLKNVGVQALHIKPEDITFESRTFQGRLRTNVQGEWMNSREDLLQGSIYVPIRQARALLVAHLLEPVSPDSLSRWGLFNTAYEITDHISNHRQLQIAQWMYKEDRRIRDRYGETLHKKLPELRKEYQHAWIATTVSEKILNNAWIFGFAKSPITIQATTTTPSCASTVRLECHEHNCRSSSLSALPLGDFCHVHPHG